MKTLIVVDMQNDFIDGVLGTPEAAAVVERVCEKITDYRNKGFQIIFTRDTHDDNYLNTQEGRKLPVKHCIKNTYGWQIHDQLPVMSDDIVVDKETFGYKWEKEGATPEAFIKGDEIELIGVCTDICVISNAIILKMKYPERQISVDASCCAGVTPQSHENALKAMRSCQIDII